MRKVSVIQYSGGNTHNVLRALEHVGGNPVMARSNKDVRHADYLVLPGVGAFGAAIEDIRGNGLLEPIRDHISAGRPFLGICVGMQLLATESEEFGRKQGLGVIPGQVIRIPKKTTKGAVQKVPHVGWGSLDSDASEIWSKTLLSDTIPGDFVYFLHSYNFKPDSRASLLATTSYGGHTISAAVHADNCYGLQFHPEKSGLVGLAILRRFLKL